MPTPRRHHHGGLRDLAGGKERDRRHDQGPDRGRSPRDHRPRDSNSRESLRGRIFPRIDAQVTRKGGRTGEPPDLPRQSLRKRRRDQEGTDTRGEPWSRQSSISHEPGNRDHHRRGTGSGEPAKNTAEGEGKPRGHGGNAEGDAGNMPRWETKRRRSAAAVFDMGDFVPGKESYPPLPTGDKEAGGPELQQNPYLKERFPLRAEIAAAPDDQWLLDDYLPTVNLNEAPIVPTGTTLMMAPRSEASSNDLPDNALRTDIVGGGDQGGAPLKEEGDGEAWGLPALDRWLAGEDEPVFPHLEDKVGLSRAG